MAPHKLHDLRKTFTKMLLDVGVPELIVRAILGHLPHTDITLTHYVGINVDTIADIISPVG